MSFVQVLLVALVIGFNCVPVAYGESTDCTTPMLIVSDGRITQSSFPQNTTFWYGIHAQAGHSYSVEFEPPADNFLNTTKIQFAALSVFSPSDSLFGCRGTSSVAVTQNSGYAPVIMKNGNGAGRRISFTAQSAGLHLIAVTNAGGGGGSYTFRGVDTTSFNLRWSTWNGYEDQWGFLNVSDMPVSGVLSIYDMNGSQIAAVPVSIPVGTKWIRRSSVGDLNLPRNRNGYVLFSHNGPPGAVIGESCVLNSTGSLETYSPFIGSGSQ